MADASFTVDILMNLIDKGTKKATASLEKSTKNIEKSTWKIKDNVKKIDFGFLSLIFAGMQLQRTFGGFLTQAIQGFLNFSGKQNNANKGVLRLTSAWEYLKFRVGQAFTESPLIEALIKGLTNLLNSLANSDGAVNTITTLVVALAALGAVLSFLGAFITLQMGLAAVGKGVLAVIGVFTWLYETLLLVIYAFGGIEAVAVATKVLPVILGWIGGLLSFILVMGLLTQKTGSIKNAFIELGFAVATIFATLGDIIISSIVTPLQYIVLAVNNVMSALNKNYQTPKWVQDFVSWKPTMAQSVADKWFDFQNTWKNTQGELTDTASVIKSLDQNSIKPLDTSIYNLDLTNSNFVDYINSGVIPSLNSEGLYVDSLTQKYNKLATAKRNATRSSLNTTASNLKSAGMSNVDIFNSLSAYTVVED